MLEKHFRPLRATPTHQWNLDHGAIMIEAGLYQRPWYFPVDKESLSDAYIREATVVRKTVGLSDISSLGKNRGSGPRYNRIFKSHLYQSLCKSCHRQNKIWDHAQR